MKAIPKFGDQLAVSAALICAIHCFFTPVLIALIPSLQALAILNDESFHLWMMAGVLPTSLMTLAMGCRKHKKKIYLAFGLLGFFTLFFAALWGHQLLGCTYEKYLTLLGALLISFVHVNNYLRCRKEKCEESEATCQVC